ncbi:MAG: ABC transporter ATP-binding protein [Leptospira sp.]|nr:ABC transporter ATP-binding protein [Leptospira sp.]
MGSIKVSHLTKEYYGFSKPSKRILAGLTFGYLGIDTRFTALKDISFEAVPGEAIGIIGRNGAGKSTLLKILAGVTKEESGTKVIKGSVRALLELSVGFNSELSGEENVYFNGLVWGYKPAQISKLMDEVFDFAGLADFRKVPLKNYSSGMAMRLGFSLATAERPEILIVDEALAVGDASFQQKCLHRFEQFLKEGSIVLFVSHDLGLVSHFCKRILLFERGKLLFDGTPKEGIESYMQILAKTEGEVNSSLTTNSAQTSSFGDFISSLDISLSKGNVTLPHLTFVGDEITLEIQFTAKQSMSQLTVGFHIDDEKGIRIFGTNTHLLQVPPMEVIEGKQGKVSFKFPVWFREGKYSIGVAFHRGQSHTQGSYLWRESLYNFEVERVNLPHSVGLLFLPVNAIVQILD